MLLLPKKIGTFTLTRKLGTGGVAESYTGFNDAAGGRPVVVRRILPYVLRDPARLASIEARVTDLLGVRHPFLVHVLDHVREGEEHFIVEEYIDGVNLDKVLAWCRQNQRQIPPNVFLNIATQVCNGLEALHGRTGKGSSAEHVLHLALKPGAVFITREGKVMVGGFGLTRSPTTLPHGGVTGPVPARMEYLSPEQTHPDQKLTPASDIFALGAILYELLTLDSLFRADSNLQTIHKVRRAEVTTQLLRAKELMPGLDKVLYRALSLNPRHRYQRAFVLREDLRGLMAGYSFATISEDTRSFAAPLLDILGPVPRGVAAAPDAPADADSFADQQSTRIDADPMTTAALTAQALQERAARERDELATGLEDAGESTESLSLRGENDPPTESGHEPLPPTEDRDRPTLPGTDRAAAAAVAAGLGAPPRRGAAALPPIELGPDAPAENTSFDALPPERPPAPRAPPPRPSTPPPPSPRGDASSTAAFLMGPGGSSTDAVAPGHLTPPRVSPPPMAAGPASTASFSSAPPRPPPPMIASLPPEPAPRAPAPAAPPPAAPPQAAAPLAAAASPAPLPPPRPAAPTPVAAAPAPIAAAPAAVAATPVVPTVTNTGVMSRPMPGPAVTKTPATGEAPSAPRPVAPRPPAPVAQAPAARPAPPVDPFADEPPRRSNAGLYFGVAALGAMALVLVCSGLGWAGWAAWSSRSASELASAPTPDGATAADVMADAAPPQLAPMDPEQDAAAVLAGLGADAPAAEAAPPPEGGGTTEPPPTEPAVAVATNPVSSPTASSPTTTSASTTSPTTSSASTSSASRPSTTTTSTASRARTEPEREVSYEAPAYTPRATTSTTTSRTRPAEEPVVASASYKAPSTSSTSSSRTAVSSFEPLPESDPMPEAPMDVSIAETPVSDLEQYVDTAKKGKLTSSDTELLSAIATSDPQYTRSRALLLMNAQRKGDDSGARRYLDALMELPENRYNPVYLTDYARWHVNHGDYSAAIEKAALAERYWSRLPPELVFTKKAEIYEIQAAAWQGRFYTSGTDVELLEKAIRDWERYRQHVSTRSREDLEQRADVQIAKLNDIKARLE